MAVARYQRSDHVQLKSGGPVMTVVDWTVGPEGEELVECVWQDAGAERKDTFAGEQLEPAA